MSETMKICKYPDVTTQLAQTIKELVNPIFVGEDCLVFDTRQTLKRLTVLSSILTNEEKSYIRQLENDYHAFILKNTDDVNEDEAMGVRLEKLTREVDEMPRYMIDSYFGGKVVKTIATPNLVHSDITSHLSNCNIKGEYTTDDGEYEVFKTKTLLAIFITEPEHYASVPKLSNEAIKEVLMFKRLADFIGIKVG